jgi:hypothetical protein
MDVLLIVINKQYDVSWQDGSTQSTMGPFAKIRRAGEALSSRSSTELGSDDRIDSLLVREQSERSFCAPTQSLHSQVDALLRESTDRTAIRKEILSLLTTATEEYDTLPEEFITRLNKVVYSIDEADERNSQLIGIEKLNTPQPANASWRLRRKSQLTNHATAPISSEPMPINPVDAQRIPVSLGPLRSKLGEMPITTCLRLRNTSFEPLRLRSGLKLKEGKYISSISLGDSQKSSSSCHLYPPSEIPPRTEIVIACRSRGGWIPTSGISGKIVYTNKDESWTFNIKFRNPLVGHDRKCRVDANPSLHCEEENVAASDKKHKVHWQISKDELDLKSNNEFIITISSVCEQEGSDGALVQHHSGVSLQNDQHKGDISPVTDYSTDTSVECVFKQNVGVILPL